MKRTIAVLLILLVAACALPGVIAASASSDFTVEGGVVVSYNGSGGKITIPDGVYSIADSAFSGNTAITAVSLPAGVSSIGNNAFLNCSSLKTVTGGDGVTFVGAHAFDGTPFLTASATEYVKVGKTLIWYNNTDAASFTLPKSLVSVAPYAFAGCHLATFSSASLVSIGEGAFYGCSSLSSVSVPAGVSYIGAYAFYGTPYLASLGTFPVVGDGILVGYNGSDAQVTIPSSVRQIASRAFADNSTMTSLRIPSSVFTIGKQAFMNCTSLSEIHFSAGLVSIGEEAFAGCTRLKEVLTPSTLSFIGKGAFIDCASLDHAYIAGSNLRISDAAFMSCAHLRCAVLGSGVLSIGAYAFAQDPKFAGVSICSSVTSIASTAFSGVKNLVLVTDAGSKAESVLGGMAAAVLQFGDSDKDGAISIFDVTHIQRYLAEIIDLDGGSICAGDADRDGEVSIFDGTHLQRKIALLD